jgi:hypothetical protein
VLNGDFHKSFHPERFNRPPKVTCHLLRELARSNNPVFVFSSLLTQHQFGLENFAIGPLNRPDFLNNFQAQVTVDQPIYDAGQTRNAVKSAELAQKMTGEEQRLVQMNVISGAARAYYGAVLAAESLKAAEQAVRSAEADLKRAEAVRAAGMSTDVDVLSIRVHLAAVTEQRIDRRTVTRVRFEGGHDVPRGGVRRAFFGGAPGRRTGRLFSCKCCHQPTKCNAPFWRRTRLTTASSTPRCGPRESSACPRVRRESRARKTSSSLPR